MPAAASAILAQAAGALELRLAAERSTSCYRQPRRRPSSPSSCELRLEIGRRDRVGRRAELAPELDAEIPERATPLERRPTDGAVNRELSDGRPDLVEQIGELEPHLGAVALEDRLSLDG